MPKAQKLSNHDVAIILSSLIKGNDFRFHEVTAIGEEYIHRIAGVSSSYLRVRLPILCKEGYLQRVEHNARDIEYQWLKDLHATENTETSSDPALQSIFSNVPDCIISFAQNLHRVIGGSQGFTVREIVNSFDVEKVFGVVAGSVAVYMHRCFELGILDGTMMKVSGRSGRGYRLYHWSIKARTCFKDDQKVVSTNEPSVIRFQGTSRLRLTEIENDLFSYLGTMEKLGKNHDRVIEGNFCEDKDILDEFFEKMVIANILFGIGNGRKGRIFRFNANEYDFWKNHLEVINEKAFQLAALNDRLDSLRERQRKMVIDRDETESGYHEVVRDETALEEKIERLKSQLKEARALLRELKTLKTDMSERRDNTVDSQLEKLQGEIGLVESQIISLSQGVSISC